MSPEKALARDRRRTAQTGCLPRAPARVDASCRRPRLSRQGDIRHLSEMVRQAGDVVGLTLERGLVPQSSIPRVSVLRAIFERMFAQRPECSLAPCDCFGPDAPRPDHELIRFGRFQSNRQDLARHVRWAEAFHKRQRVQHLSLIIRESDVQLSRCHVDPPPLDCYIVGSYSGGSDLRGPLELPLVTPQAHGTES